MENKEQKEKKDKKIKEQNDNQKNNKSVEKNKTKKQKDNKPVKEKKNKEKKNKDKKPNKFIEIIKKKWLINGTKTLILVLIILAIFFGINIGMQKAEITPLDFSKEKLFTLTQASKDKVKTSKKTLTYTL